MRSVTNTGLGSQPGSGSLVPRHPHVLQASSTACAKSQVHGSCKSPSPDQPCTLLPLFWGSCGRRGHGRPFHNQRSSEVHLPTLQARDQGEPGRRAQRPAWPSVGGGGGTPAWHLMLEPLSGKASLWFHHQLPLGFKSTQVSWQIRKRAFRVPGLNPS